MTTKLSVEALEKAASSVTRARPGRAALVEGKNGPVLLVEFDGVRVGDAEQLAREAQAAAGGHPVEVVRTDWLPWSKKGPQRAACQTKYRRMLDLRAKTERVDLLNFKNDVTEAQKDSFGYFGTQSRIMGPFELNAPSRIHLGNWVSFGRYGRVLMNTDFTKFKERCLQHYPEVAHDYSPKVFGPRDPKLKIGDGTTIGDGVFINCTNNIEIGKHLIISSRVYIGDAGHNVMNLDLPITLSANTEGRPVKIGDQTWIGVGAVIMEGITIGKHAIIGSNSVVTKSVPDYGVAAGVPAKLIKMLDGSPLPVPPVKA
ncbi:MAG: acyltransferase [Elusimicrobiota bacterium]|nr:acyltransferase [Elusimicrobiota bacterium]